MTTINRSTSGRLTTFVAVAIALILLPAFAVEASAQAFVTGSGNTPGFSIAGYVGLLKNGEARGQFLIVMHRDVPEFTTAAAVCSYSRFDQVVIGADRATFHSVGTCVALTTAGQRQVFTSDNVFTILDGGEPGPANDAIDVNFLGVSGVAVPGRFLLHGNFIVNP